MKYREWIAAAAMLGVFGLVMRVPLWSKQPSVKVHPFTVEVKDGWAVIDSGDYRTIHLRPESIVGMTLYGESIDTGSLAVEIHVSGNQYRLDCENREVAEDFIRKIKGAVR